MAGDIREIDMTKATSLDGKKVRLVGDDGKGYWMEKDTFISVVGGLLGINETWLYLKGDSVDNMDNFTETGFYTVNKGEVSPVNYPPEGSYGGLIVFATRMGNWIWQICYFIDGSVFSRARDDKQKWTAWSKLSS